MLVDQIELYFQPLLFYKLPGDPSCGICQCLWQISLPDDSRDLIRVLVSGRKERDKLSAKRGNGNKINAGFPVESRVFSCAD